MCATTPYFYIIAINSTTTNHNNLTDQNKNTKNNQKQNY